LLCEFCQQDAFTHGGHCVRRASANASSPVGGNPLDALPQIKPPKKGPNATAHIQPQALQVQELLARHLTPTKIQIQGVKSIPFNDVAQRFASLVGHDITVGELIDIANGVTRLYQERGYALSFAFVPAQTFENGVVHVTVVEGYTANVKITGNPGKSEDRLRAIAAHIVAERPLRRATF
jgi:hemolysin activation/secretion protein